MKRILCFGDSNTWGYNPEGGTRYDENTRWTAVLQNLLGNDYTVIEEGQNGRTIACDDPWEGNQKNGMKYLLPMLESQSPLDYFVIMLGTNDLKIKFSLPVGDIAGSLCYMIEKAKAYFHNNNQHTKIVILSPVSIGEGISNKYFGEFFEGETSVKKSKNFAYWYKLVAEKYGCDFIDMAQVAQPGNIDCLHLMPEGHKAIAEELYKYFT